MGRKKKNQPSLTVDNTKRSMSFRLSIDEEKAVMKRKASSSSEAPQEEQVIDVATGPVAREEENLRPDSVQKFVPISEAAILFVGAVCCSLGLSVSSFYVAFEVGSTAHFTIAAYVAAHVAAVICFMLALVWAKLGDPWQQAMSLGILSVIAVMSVVVLSLSMFRLVEEISAPVSRHFVAIAVPSAVVYFGFFVVCMIFHWMYDKMIMKFVAVISLAVTKFSSTLVFAPYVMHYFPGWWWLEPGMNCLIALSLFIYSLKHFSSVSHPKQESHTQTRNDEQRTSQAASPTSHVRAALARASSQKSYNHFGVPHSVNGEHDVWEEIDVSSPRVLNRI